MIHPLELAAISFPPGLGLKPRANSSNRRSRRYKNSGAPHAKANVTQLSSTHSRPRICSRLLSCTIQITTAVAPIARSLDRELAAGFAFASRTNMPKSKLDPYSLMKSRFASQGSTAPLIAKARYSHFKVEFP